MNDEEKKSTNSFWVGEDVSLLSVDELNERITALQAEITRLELAVRNKRDSRASADQVFKI